MDPATAVALALGLIDRGLQFAAAAEKARSEGRDLSDAELQAFRDADDAARKALEEAIKAAG